MMLEKVVVSQKLPKEEYDRVFPGLERELSELQQRVRALGVPVIVLFEGWDASGKGTLINRLLLCLDPRGFKVHPINPPTDEELRRPFLWRFWIRTPERGKMAIFDRSWYGRVLVERVDKLVKKSVWSKAYGEILSFERQLVDDGFVLVKFFLHIGKKEQKRRFMDLEENPSTAWKVTKTDWEHNADYDKWLVAIEEMLLKTDSGFAPWTIVEAHDRRFATVKVFRTLVEALERRMAASSGSAGLRRYASVPPRAQPSASTLDGADLSLALSGDEYEISLKKCQARMRELEHEVYVRRVPVVIVFQGWDAAGKGGAIKRLVQGMDPRGYDVIPIGAPNDVEKAHHYLWRFWMSVPKSGHFAVFDRSWYGRVLDERVEGLCAEEEWKRAYGEINEFEEQLASHGAVIVKFWLQIDEDEQLRRFRERENTPHKRWKITPEDWRNREKRSLYRAAIDEMLLRTSTADAPWTIVESNSKWYARIKVLKTVIERVEERIFKG